MTRIVLSAVLKGAIVGLTAALVCLALGMSVVWPGAVVAFGLSTLTWILDGVIAENRRRMADRFREEALARYRSHEPERTDHGR